MVKYIQNFSKFKTEKCDVKMYILFAVILQMTFQLCTPASIVGSASKLQRLSWIDFIDYLLIMYCIHSAQSACKIFEHLLWLFVILQMLASYWRMQ